MFHLRFQEEGSHGSKSKLNFRRKESGWRVRCTPLEGKHHLMTHVSFAKNPDTRTVSVSSKNNWANEKPRKEVQGTNMVQEQRKVSCQFNGEGTCETTGFKFWI